MWKYLCNEIVIFIFSHSQLLNIVDRVIKEADENCDEMISFEEFQKAVQDLDIETKMAFVVFQWMI